MRVGLKQLDDGVDIASWVLVALLLVAGCGGESEDIKEVGSGGVPYSSGGSPGSSRNPPPMATNPGAGASGNNGSSAIGVDPISRTDFYDLSHTRFGLTRFKLVIPQVTAQHGAMDGIASGRGRCQRPRIQSARVARAPRPIFYEGVGRATQI
jgi:hypothetical protein